MLQASQTMQEDERKSEQVSFQDIEQSSWSPASKWPSWFQPVDMCFRPFKPTPTAMAGSVALDAKLETTKLRVAVILPPGLTERGFTMA